MNNKPAIIEKITDNFGNQDYIYRSNKHLKLSGPVLELKKFEESFPLFLPKERKIRDKKEKRIYEPKEIEYRCYIRAKTRVRDYVNSNAGYHFSITGRAYLPILITITIAENISDINMTNNWFTKYIIKLSKAFPEVRLKYLAVPEFQKRGSVHYHCIFFNLPFRNNIKQIFQSNWVFGYTQVKATNRIKNIGKYISKYLTKSFSARGLMYKKSYFISRGLLKPLKTNFDEIIAQVMDLVPAESLEYESKDIKTERLGAMDYRQYNLKDYPRIVSQMKSILDI